MFTRKSKIRRGEDGMTMIELVIAMVVLAHRRGKIVPPAWKRPA